MSDDLPTDASRHPLFRHLVTHPVAVAMMFIAAAVFGYVSYARLSVELMPDISYPTITVRTAYEGAAPEEVERELSRPIEEALARGQLGGAARLPLGHRHVGLRAVDPREPADGVPAGSG